MYYALTENYALRGWQKLTAVLVKRPENHIHPLIQSQLNLLMLCDGEMDLTDDLLSDEETAQLQKFAEQGIVTASETSCPVAEDQLYRYHDNRYVESAFWSITGRCNYHCRHCYMDAPEAKLGEISHEAALDLIDQMDACGILKVDITGGEPFVRGDFWDLIDRLISYKIHIGKIYTNAWLLNEKVLDAFEVRGLHPAFSVSFDGLGWHDWMRRVNGAEEAAMRAFRLCKERGYAVDVECIVHKGNEERIRETVNALAEVGVWSVRLGPVVCTDLWKQNGEGLELTTEEYNDFILDYIPQYFEDGMPTDVFAGGMVSLKKGSKDVRVLMEKGHDDAHLDCHLCGAVRYSCYITPEGRLLPCMPMTASPKQEEFPLIADIGLQKGLSDSAYMQYADARIRDLLARNKKCAGCEYRLRCGGGCRANALSSGNGFWGEDPEVCLFWQKGYADRIHRVVDEATERFCAETSEDTRENNA